MNTVIIVDSCSDLPIDFVHENNIPVLGLTYVMDGKEYADDLGKSMSYKYFYSKIREGAMPTTSQINTHTFSEEFKKHIRLGKSIIYMGLSSELSGCVSSARTAREMVLDEYKDADITIIDTKRATMGCGLLVMHAFEMLKNGCTKAEVVNWVEDNKLSMKVILTLDNLFHLKRGGRLSGSAAFLGTLLSIKPILHIDNEGKLLPIGKAQGRKKSLSTLIEMTKSQIVDPEKQIAAVSHTDCVEDAEYLKKALIEEVGVKDVIITFVGPVIGSHAGADAIGIFFYGR